MKPQLLKIGGVAVVVVLLLAGALLYAQNQTESAEETDLTFTVSPHEVEVTIDGEDYGTVATGDTLTVPVHSEADIEVTRDGFVPYSATMAIDPGVAHSVEVELHPETSEAESLLEEEQQLTSEQTATERQLNAAEEAYEDYPILHDLPQHGQAYSAHQGLAEEAGYEFGIHLYLYEGHEEEGREAFEEWLSEEDYSAGDYDIIEHVEDEEPPATLPEAPSWAELEEMTLDDAEVPTEVSADDLTQEELALLFAETSATWDTAEDVHHTEGLLRATPLMSKDIADTVEMPHRPTTTPTWRDAAAFDARSVAWVHYYEDEEAENGTAATVDVCWAWITDSETVFVDGPRTLDLTVGETSSGPRIVDFTYEDPDPFVDNSNSRCRPDDAPQ